MRRSGLSSTMHAGSSRDGVIVLVVGRWATSWSVPVEEVGEIGCVPGLNAGDLTTVVYNGNKKQLVVVQVN